ncbi:MAG TPA: hypothetical protein VMT68_07205 [Caulobacteraceae bacterium]|nr:hypothetical protein [Caulobacteraceae bacterium]
MKLVIAVACLAASLSLASHALADGRTEATLAQPVPAKTQFLANGAIWDCEGTTCVAANTPEQSFGASQCRDVSKRFGAVAEFKNEYKSLQPASLDRCNAGIAPRTTTASR